MSNPYISAVIIVSENPINLKDFYKNVFNLDFEEDSHGKLKTHYVATFGYNRLIIHLTSTYPHTKPQQGSVHFSISVDSIEKVIENLNQYGSEILSVSDEVFGKRVEFKDIDGNFVQAVQLR